VQQKSLRQVSKKGTSLVSGGEALRLKNFLTERNLWLPRVFHRISSIPVEAADEQVSGDLLIQTLEAAMREIRQPSLPVEFGATVRTVDMGIYGMVIQTAADVGEALERSVRFFRLMVTTNRVFLETQEKSVRWIFHSPEPDRLGIRIRNEIILTEHVALLKFIAPGARPIRVTFAHAEPNTTTIHQRYFDCPLVWNSGENSVEWAADLMHRPLGVDQSLGEFIQREAERRLAMLAPIGSLNEISDAILRRLPVGDTDLPTIAGLLGRSTRTMRRELTELGFTFRSLHDLVRQRRANELLSSGKYSMTQIALSLGFSEASAFSRASRRWSSEIVNK
jgi:AraC-like DNA-binding protein